MRIPCNYCNNFIDESDEKCPHCGAVNERFKRTANNVPTTIAELQQFCAAHNLTPERTHFYIGIDYRGPKAFGIYQDPVSGKFVVYKNKSDGTRAVRYEGPDEAYAVNEIYQKMREIALSNPGNGQQINNNTGKTQQNTGNASKKKSRSAVITYLAFIGITMLCVILLCVALADDYKPGYYYYHDDYYYTNGSSWFIYDDYDDSWSTTDINSTFKENYSDYSTSWSSSYGTGYSEYFGYDSDSSYDSDDSWDSWTDSDGWDSYSDWDSDW